MGEPLEKPPEELHLLGVEDLDRALAELPAKQRAKLRWTRPRLLSAITSLRTGQATPTVLSAAVEDLLAVSGAIVPAILALRARRPPGTGDEAWARPIEEDWRARLQLVTDFLADRAAAESAEYAFRAVGAMFAAIPLVVPEGTTHRELIGEVPEAKRPSVARSDAAGVLRAQLLLMAILAEQRDGRPPQLARELAHQAFLEAKRGVAALRLEWPWFEPFAEEAEEARGERALRAVAQFRDAATDADHAAIFGGDDASQ